MESSLKVLIVCMLSKVTMTLLEFEGMTSGLDPHCPPPRLGGLLSYFAGPASTWSRRSVCWNNGDLIRRSLVGILPGSKYFWLACMAPTILIWLRRRSKFTGYNNHRKITFELNHQFSARSSSSWKGKLVSSQRIPMAAALKPSFQRLLEV